MIDDTNGILINVGSLIPNQTSTWTRQYLIEQSNLNQGYIESQATAIGSYLSHQQTRTIQTTASTQVTLPQVIALQLTKTAD